METNLFECANCGYKSSASEIVKDILCPECSEILIVHRIEVAKRIIELEARVLELEGELERRDSYTEATTNIKTAERVK